MASMYDNGASLGVSSVGSYEPKGKWLWVVVLQVPAGVAGNGRIFTNMARSSMRPTHEFNKVEVTHLNEYSGTAGKIKKPEDFVMEFNDGIAQTCETDKTVDFASAMNDWKKVIYDETKGYGECSSVYKTIAVVKLLSANMRITEQWSALGAFPTKIEHGELKYEAGSEGAVVKVSFNVDKWYYGDITGKDGTNSGLSVQVPSIR